MQIGDCPIDVRHAMDVLARQVGRGPWLNVDPVVRLLRLVTLHQHLGQTLFAIGLIVEIAADPIHVIQHAVNSIDAVRGFLVGQLLNVVIVHLFLVGYHVLIEQLLLDKAHIARRPRLENSCMRNT